MAQMWKSSILFLKYHVSLNNNLFLTICIAETKYMTSRVLIVAVQLLPWNVSQPVILQQGEKEDLTMKEMKNNYHSKLNTQ